MEFINHATSVFYTLTHIKKLEYIVSSLSNTNIPKKHYDSMPHILKFLQWFWLLFVYIILTNSQIFTTRVPLADPDSKVHWNNMGRTLVLSAPDGPHDGPMNLAIKGPPDYPSVSRITRTKATRNKPQKSRAKHGPLSRYVKWWVAHVPWMPGTFSPPPISKESSN